MSSIDYEVHQYPEHPSYIIDRLDQRKQYYIGFWQGSVILADGTQRAYLTYCSTHAKRDARHCHLALPSGADPVDFLRKSGWIDIAEKDEAVLTVFLPSHGQWGTPDEESEYFKKTYNGLRYYTPYGSFDWRWVGYGDGGACMQRYIMSDPIYCAAAVIIDGCEGFDEQMLADISGTHHKAGRSELTETLGSTPVPVWLISRSFTDSAMRVVSYWRKANDCLDDPVTLADGTVEYRQDPFSTAVETYDRMCGTVRYTRMDCGNYLLPELSQAAYAFVTSFSRNGAGSPYSNSLSFAPTPQTYTHLTYETDIVDGYAREWYVYTPRNYDPAGEKLPLVIYFHGTHQSGLVSFRQSDWWKVADRHNFIVCMPSGTLEQSRMPGKVPGMSWNLENYGNADDISFVRFLVKHMIDSYPVDPSRIYANGQSNGGRMTLYCAFALPELFAAVASMGASTLGKSYDSPDEYIVPSDTVTAYDIPVMSTVGENDMFNYDLSDVHGTGYLRCKYFCDRYNMDYTGDRYHYENGRYINDIWIDEHKVPMLRQTVSLRRAHNFNPRETEMTWNEWFVKYQRDPETGKVIYMGRERG